MPPYLSLFNHFESVFLPFSRPFSYPPLRLTEKHYKNANAYKNPQQASQGVATAIHQETEDDFHTLYKPSQQPTAHKKQCNQNDNTNNRQHSYLFLFYLFFWTNIVSLREKFKFYPNFFLDRIVFKE